MASYHHIFAGKLVHKIFLCWAGRIFKHMFPFAIQPITWFLIQPTNNTNIVSAENAEGNAIAHSLKMQGELRWPCRAKNSTGNSPPTLGVPWKGPGRQVRSFQAYARHIFTAPPKFAKSRAGPKPGEAHLLPQIRHMPGICLKMGQIGSKVGQIGICRAF